MSRLIDRARPPDSERGAALIVVILIVTIFAGFAAVIVADAGTEFEEASSLKREDQLLAIIEATMERYAAKMTQNPSYYNYWVDEGERARICTDASSGLLGTVVQPGNPWVTGCASWSYQDPPDSDGDGESDWFTHPLYSAASGSGIAPEVALEVVPPATGQPLSILVAGKRGSEAHRRAVRATIEASALSEFFRVTEFDLAYGAGAVLTGPVYSGANLDFNGSPIGTVSRDIFAEGDIQDEPTYLSGALGFDADGDGAHGLIRDRYDAPLAFNNFWDDLAILQTAACGSSFGFCLRDSDVVGTVRAWRVHPYQTAAGIGRIRISYSLTTPTVRNGSGSCPTSEVTAEEAWWLLARPSYPSSIHTRDVDANWQPYGLGDTGGAAGDYAMPNFGVLWADNHLIVGDRSQTPAASVLKNSITMYAGTSANPRNVIVNSDFTLAQPNLPSTDVGGLIASDEVILNPYAVGSDAVMNIHASLLGQADNWRVAGCYGSGGSILTPGSSILNATGSIATRGTGAISGHFPTRNYNFDSRLEFLRPPFFPLLDDRWRYQNWREEGLPAWVPR